MYNGLKSELTDNQQVMSESLKTKFLSGDFSEHTLPD